MPHVTSGVFDLDHTLYPPSARLFDLIETRMTAWEMESLRVDKTEAVHVAPSRAEGSHVHFFTDDLSGFLSRLV